MSYGTYLEKADDPMRSDSQQPEEYQHTGPHAARGALS
jgi:hypothetical protein